MGSKGSVEMRLEVVTVTRSEPPPADRSGEREELVRRVGSSVTFEKSPRLRAFFFHVCRCAFENEAEKATEQQIGIYVYGRRAGYNPNEDNIVRSQARVLRMKLEHHFANEGKDEAVVITIPKGQYLPVFVPRPTEPPKPTPDAESPDRRIHLSHKVLAGAVLLLGILIACAAYLLVKSRPRNAPPAVPHVAPVVVDGQPEADTQTKGRPIDVAPDAGDIRIAAGHAGASFVDVLGERWNADRYYQGGVVKSGPRHLFPPVAQEGLFRSIREAASDGIMVPQSERGFQYNIPVAHGVYELRLYFADPRRQPETDNAEDAENQRHFQVVLNGRPLLTDLDPVADAGFAAVDVRAFKDVRPASDGKVHLEFHSDWGRAFVSALELTPGKPGKLNPIRIAARPSDFIDEHSIRWSGDKYFIDGRTWFYENPPTGPLVPSAYAGERHGNFSYAIPVPPGSYTVRLHFLESFFSPLIPAATCHGEGCRVFDVTCNGVMLLQNFDVTQAAGGVFRPVVREFKGLRPNGQGKLLFSFSPKVNYAEIRAIEVLDEAN